ncbi:SdrD B-like domain-containing protein, partial [Chlamydiota bacterium]
MKKSKLKILSVLLFFVCGTFFFASDYSWAGDESNGSFEQGSGTTAADWTSFKPLGSPLIAERKGSGALPFGASPYSGSYAMHMNCFGGDFIGIYQNFFDILPDAEIALSGYARTDNMGPPGEAFGQFIIEYYKWDGDDEVKLATFRSTEIRSVNASGGYVRFSVTGKAPDETQFARVVILADGGLGGGGDIIFDLVSVSLDNGPLPPVEISGKIYSTENWENVPKVFVGIYSESGALIASTTHNPYLFLVLPLRRYYYRVEAEGHTFPSTAELSFDPAPGAYGEVFEMAKFGGVIDIPVDPGYPIILTKKVHKTEVSRGDILVYTLVLENKSIYPMEGMQIRDELPDGFHYLEGSTLVNGKPAGDPTRNSPLNFTIGSIPGSGKHVISYRASIGTRVKPGREFTSTAHAWSTARDWQISNESSVTVRIAIDPLFDLGTVIGKVFNDVNKNGIQDEDELGVAGVRLVTEYGVIVYTDFDGKYHIPAVRPGRHVIKIDKDTLPAGSEVLTEEAYLVKITEGLLAKVNFAVTIPEEEITDPFAKQLKVTIMPNTDYIKPKLSVSVSHNEIVFDELVENGVILTTSCNYRSLVAMWTLQIKDFSGTVIQHIERSGIIPEEVWWDGKDEMGNIVKSGRIYSYQLTVFDEKDNMSSTSVQYFKVVKKKQIGDLFLIEDTMTIQSNYTGTNRISLDAMHSVKIKGKLGFDTVESVEIDDSDVTVSEENTFEEELYLSPGVHLLRVHATSEEGRAIVTTKEVTIKDEYFIMVGFAEGELGHRDISENLESSGVDDEFEDGFYTKGRLAYFLKGKIRGKYIV